MRIYSNQVERFKKNRVKTAYTLVYKLVYELAYIYVVSPMYSYMELTYTPNYTKLIISILIMGICVCFLPTNAKKASTFRIDVFFIFTIIPISGMYWMKDQSTSYFFMCILSFEIVIFISNMFKEKSKRIKFNRMIDPCVILLILVILGILLLTVKYGFANLTALNLEDVYEVRSMRKYSGITAYIVNWLPKAIIPCFMVFSLYGKKYVYFMISVSAQFYLYLFTGAKTTLFSIVLILFSYILMNKNTSKYIERWSQFLILGVGGSVLLAWKSKSITLLAIVCMRLSAVPANISFKHYNFFSENPKLYFSETIFGRIFGIKSPYPEFSTMMLGGAGGNANTGYLGDAYANGGFIVMIIYSVILALIFRVIDSMDKKYISVIVSCFVYSVIMLNDGSLTVCLITGGMFLIFPFVWIFMSYEDRREKHNVLFKQDVKKITNE